MGFLQWVTAFITGHASVSAPATPFAAAADGLQLAAHYGDFAAFLYRPDFDRFLRTQVLPFREPDSVHLGFLDEDHWPEIHPFNFPGPFYTGSSDTCGTGVGEAPANVMNDADCCEFVFRQPVTFHELDAVLNAAAVEVFDSYSSNGHERWTYAACRAWWANRDTLLRHLADEGVAAMNDGQVQRYGDYLRGDAEADLRRYCYFLLNGSYPTDPQIPLPEL
ncbi:hypothetical protein [Hymenobacter canadensis]|uniref:Ferredoxin n=1 Tax=Hymenobacter canadensis TaxID=2999067 RepID=A0ABY7LZ20_9BACT|nr:hypothetical protein [Hymenobacter canadensis]WBA44198.1 hypothetical protein O3303_20130 [Hymenobacter canadensis]